MLLTACIQENLAVGCSLLSCIRSHGFDHRTTAKGRRKPCADPGAADWLAGGTSQISPGQTPAPSVQPGTNPGKKGALGRHEIPCAGLESFPHFHGISFLAPSYRFAPLLLRVVQFWNK